MEEVVKQICTLKNYQFESFVAKGSFKETFHVLDEGKSYALKILLPDKVDGERLLREVSAIRKCESNFIVKILHIEKCLIDGQEYIYSLEDYLDGGTLTDHIESNKLSNPNILQIGRGILFAISELQYHRLVHRDIKPDNILFRSGSYDPILVDFGIVRDLNKDTLTKSFYHQGPCTPFFAAPEQLNNSKHLISWKTDIFSLGLVLAYAFTKKHPFGTEAADFNDAIQNVSKRLPVTEWFKEFINASQMLWLEKMLEPYPIRRYNDIMELIEEIEEHLR